MKRGKPLSSHCLKSTGSGRFGSTKTKAKGVEEKKKRKKKEKKEETRGKGDTIKGRKRGGQKGRKE